MPQLVRIEKVKRPGASGLWGAYETAVDGWGRWLFTPRGSLFQTGTGEAATYCNVGSPTGPGIPVIHLIVSQAWWIATFWEPGETEWSVTFDICTRPAFVDGCWRYIDLELDVSVTASSGEMSLEDEDEFRSACSAGWIDDHEAASARSAVDQIRTLVEPADTFIEAGLAHLAAAQTLGLSPLRHLT